jgi:NAD(P)-dependent dehydrogenase (short-subunit alcohol dehydrogenase family)
MGKLQNKHVLVTGGTTGIGLETARLFAAEGARVTVTGTNPKSIAAAQAELGPNVEVLRSDAGSTADIEQLAQQFASTGLDVLFLNAGLAKFGSITELSESVFDELYRINVRGPWLAIKHFAKHLRRGGSIVLNTSVNNQLGMAGSAAYASSKAAARSLMQVAANELSAQGVRVNAVSPGPVRTPLHDKFGLSKEAQQGMAEGLIAQIPLRRFGEPQEIARAVLFLASDESSFMTGEEIVVDGGMTRV